MEEIYTTGVTVVLRYDAQSADAGLVLAKKA
jgi:hypothetical protein